MRFKAASARGIISNGAVLSHHTFSFGTYIDLEGMCFHQLKVLSFEVFPPRSFLNLEAKSDYCLCLIQVRGCVEYRDKDKKFAVNEENRLVKIDKNSGTCYTLSNELNEVAEIYQIWLKGSCAQVEDVKICSIAKDSTLKKRSVNKKIWIQCLQGELIIGQFKLAAGDGLAIDDEENVEVKTSCESEFIWIQVPTS